MNTTVHANTIKGDKGFTLIEVLIALAIFSIGILAVASMQLTARLQSRNSSEITEATAIAYNQMEELMLRSFDDNDLNGPFVGNNLDLTLNPHLLYSGKYSIQWTVTASKLNTDAGASNDSKTVDLTVSWNKIISSGSNQRQVKFLFIKHNE